MTDLITLFSFGPQGWGDELLRGLGVTVHLAVTAFVLSMIFGLLGASAKLSRFWLLRALAYAYTTVLRGLPDILIIFLLYYGSISVIQQIAISFGPGWRIGSDPFVVGAFTLGLVSGAYTAEVLRGAILAISQGQIDAAYALGMSRLMCFYRIILPQMLRLALPGLSNIWQVLLKDTSLLSIIGVNDLLRISATASGSTRLPFTFYLTTAILFLLLTLISMVIITWLERRFSYGYRTE